MPTLARGDVVTKAWFNHVIDHLRARRRYSLLVGIFVGIATVLLVHGMSNHQVPEILPLTTESVKSIIATFGL